MSETHFPPSMPLPNQIEHLLVQIENLKRKIRDLEAPTPEETAAEKAQRQEEEREEADRIRDKRLADRAAAELAHARAQAIRAIAKLLPEAIKQAKAKPPKPALLRLILRATR